MPANVNGTSAASSAISRLHCAASASSGVNSSDSPYTVEITRYEFDEDDYNGDTSMNRLTLDILAGKAPDVVSAAPFQLDKLSRNGYLTALSPLMESGTGMTKEDFLDSVTDSVEKDGEIIPLPRVVYNHLIELVPNAKCLDQKERFVIRLHKGIFFTRLQKNYILLYSGITPKLTVHYGSYPPRHTLNLLEYILVAGNNKLEDGTRQCQISVVNLQYILSPEDSALYKYDRLNQRYKDAIKALVACNVIKDTGLDKIELRKGKESKKAVITFTIADDFFREKEEVKSLEEIPENDLTLTNPT